MKPSSSSSGSRSSRSGSSSTRSTANSASRSQRTLSTEAAPQPGLATHAYSLVGPEGRASEPKKVHHATLTKAEPHPAWSPARAEPSEPSELEWTWLPCFPRSQDLRTLLVTEAQSPATRPPRTRWRAVSVAVSIAWNRFKWALSFYDTKQEKGCKLIISQKASHGALRPEWGKAGVQICVCVDQDLWWKRLGKGELNTLKTSHLRCFVSILRLNVVKKKWDVVHKFSMRFCKPTGLLWLFRVKWNPQPYISPSCTVYWAYCFWEISKKEIHFFWPDFIYHKVWILILQGVELVGGEEWFEFLPLYPLLISHFYQTIRELRKEFKMCDRGLWKTFHLNDIQRVTDRYQKYILEQLWTVPQIRRLWGLPCWISGAKKHSLCVIWQSS